MNQFKPSYSRLKNILVSSAAVIGLASVAQAQVAELKGLRDNKDFGGSSSFYLPLGNNINTGMPFLSVGAGLLGGSKSGEALVGFGKGLGDTIGIRGYAGVVLKDSHHNLFTTARAGVEVSFGGVGLNVSGSVPFGKTRQVAKNGHTGVVLVDPTGQQCDPTGACVPPTSSCSNPLPGQVKHCEIGVAVTDPSYEKALKGFEVGLDYQVQVGGVWLRPSLGYYRYGNGIVSGAKAGFEVSVPLTSQLSLNVGIGGQNEFNGDNKGLSGFGSLGISYHFGSVPVSQLSALEHRFAEAPTRNQRTLTTHTKQGNTVVYRPGAATEQQGLVPSPFTPVWDQTNHAVSEVWLVDHSNEAMADEIVAGAKEGAIVVFDGSKGDIILDDQIVLSAGYQGMVGGGNTLKFYTAFGDIYTTLPGSRGKVVQNDKTKDVFYANGVENPVLYGLDIEGGMNGAEFVNANHARVIYVDGRLANQSGFNFYKSDDVLVSHVTSTGSGLASTSENLSGFRVNASKRIVLQDVSSLEYGTGLGFGTASNDAKLQNIHATGFTVAMTFYNSENAQLSNIVIDKSGQGINFNTSGGAKIENLSMNEVRVTGLDFYFSPNITLNHAKFYKTDFAISVEISDNANINDVQVNDASRGTAIKSRASNNLTISNVDINDASTGIAIGDSDMIQLDHITISKVRESGINLAGVKNVLVHDVNVSDFGQYGIALFQYFADESNNIVLDTVTVEGDPTKPTSTTGIYLRRAGDAGQEIVFKNVLVKNAYNGYQFDKDSAVKDLGGNQASNVTNVCDGAADATGTVKVLNLGTGLTETCQ